MVLGDDGIVPEVVPPNNGLENGVRLRLAFVLCRAVSRLKRPERCSGLGDRLIMGTVLLDATCPLKWRSLRFIGEIKTKQIHFKRFLNYFDGNEGGRSPILYDSTAILVEIVGASFDKQPF